MSPLTPLCLCTSAIWVPTPRFLRWHMSINEAKWTLMLSLCASRITSLFALDLPQIPCWNCVELFPFLVHGSLCIRNLHCLWHREKLMHQIIMCHRSESFSSNAIFMCFGLQRVCSLSRTQWDSTIQLYIVLHSFSWPFFCSTFSFTMLECCLSRFQGMAGAIGLFSFSSFVFF